MLARACALCSPISLFSFSTHVAGCLADQSQIVVIGEMVLDACYRVAERIFPSKYLEAELDDLHHGIDLRERMILSKRLSDRDHEAVADPSTPPQRLR